MPVFLTSRKNPFQNTCAVYMYFISKLWLYMYCNANFEMHYVVNIFMKPFKKIIEDLPVQTPKVC